MTCKAVSDQQKPTPPTTAETPLPHDAANYEHEHVHSVYSEIAPHFAATRHAPWPKVNQFIASLPHHAVVADVGCGNGKYLFVANDSANKPFVVGTDFCLQLVQFAYNQGRQRLTDLTKQETDHEPHANPHFRVPSCDNAVADALRLPFRDATFDAAINIAVIHHLSTRARRVEALRETVRILRPKGQALIYVWALERPSTPKPKHGNRAAKMLSRRFASQDVFVPWHMRTRKEGATDDRILGDWDHVHNRYYHVYKQGELEQDIAAIQQVKLIELYYDHQNWCAIVEKLP